MYSIIIEPIAISILLPPPHVLERTPDSVGSYFLSYTVAPTYKAFATVIISGSTP